MTSADVQRLATRANANSSVQPSGLSSSAAVRSNAAATEGLALCWMESKSGQFSAAISRIGGSGVEARPVEGLPRAALWGLAVPAEGRVGDVRRRAGTLHHGVAAVAARGRMCTQVGGEMRRRGAR
jgi:hypothetical protein